MPPTVPRRAPAGLPTGPCPCDTGRAYTACCGRYHAGALHLQAPDAAALMRSRYSAYVLGLTDYLLATWDPGTRPTTTDLERAGPRWIGLQVLRHTVDDADHARVEFIARHRVGGRAHRLHEHSRFVRQDGHWRYVDGEVVES